MIYRFADCTLDIPRRELRRAGEVVALEPQVFALLQLLIENRHRVVTRDEVLDEIWSGRFVSDAVLSSRLKSVRRAIADDGRRQGLIQTYPKVGFRFCGEVEADQPRASLQPRPADPPASADGIGERPSVAVLAFRPFGDATAGGLAEALPHDIIAGLARLRWLRVIARGSSFHFLSGACELDQVKASLGVRYVLSGTVGLDGGRILVTVELSDASDGAVVWGDRMGGSVGAVHEIREEIVRSVIGALDLHIPLHEAERARLRAPEALDAWTAFHTGLRALYRFTPEGNARAAALFGRAVALDPTFARAHAGLSFTHFEDAFLGFSPDRAASVDGARNAAERGLEIDPLDPFCNLVMGRTFWLTGELDASLPWLDRAVRLNPNYAQGHYSRAWALTLLDETLQGRSGADTALDLSPLDPLAYGMCGVRSLSHAMNGEGAAAAEWGERAAGSPGAHALIDVVAAIAHAINGDREAAERAARRALSRDPRIDADTFLAAFPMRTSAGRERVVAALKQAGF